MSIIDLNETSPNNWKAKYRGNYGTYTIKIVTVGDKIKSFSCSCPSDYYPCKHIPMVEQEIKKLVSAALKKVPKEDTISLKDVLKNASIDELRNFIIRLAKHNQDLSNAIMLEFSQKMRNSPITDSTDSTDSTEYNYYSSIIREALQEEDIDYDEMNDYDGYWEIDVLDQWIDKARQYADEENFSEAILVCKACIEEYADWLLDIDDDTQDYIDGGYQDLPFEILEDIVAKTDAFSEELYHYCKTEIDKDKYEGTGMFDSFNDLMGHLAPKVDPDDFIQGQDKLLKAIADKKSYEAKLVIQRKIDFYNSTNQDDKAWDLVASNIQIESYRKLWVEKNIAENKLSVAKQLIMDFLSTNKNTWSGQWKELLLTIAKKEHDTPTIRSISFSFIDSHFKKEYYSLYKSTYTPQEWSDEFEKLIRHYQKNTRSFSSSIADMFVADYQTERLMDYVEKNLSIETLESYHTHFPSPEKTLMLFRQVIDVYVQKNTGRSHYEYTAILFAKMKKINGGNVVVNEMILKYKQLYKNRRAMIEIFDRL